MMLTIHITILSLEYWYETFFTPSHRTLLTGSSLF